MADTQGTRRSGRARKAVNTYADEQAEQQSTEAAAPVKRKKPAAKGTKSKRKNTSADDASSKPNSADADEQDPPRKKTKKAKSVAEEAGSPALDVEPYQDDDDFKPAPKKARKKKAAAATGKLDSEGVMRLDTTEQRPVGEKKPPRVYPIPPRGGATKGKSSVNLAAILAESFEDRWERKVSKIPRLKPGAPEVRLKE